MEQPAQGVFIQTPLAPPLVVVPKFFFDDFVTDVRQSSFHPHRGQSFGDFQFPFQVPFSVFSCVFLSHVGLVVQFLRQVVHDGFHLAAVCHVYPFGACPQGYFRSRLGMPDTDVPSHHMVGVVFAPVVYEDGVPFIGVEHEGFVRLLVYHASFGSVLSPVEPCHCGYTVAVIILISARNIFMVPDGSFLQVEVQVSLVL